MPPLVVPVSSCRRANGACDRLRRASANHPNGHGATLGATLSCQGDLAAAGCASAGDHAPRARHRRGQHARLGRHLLRGLGGSRGRARHQHACSAETPQPPLSGRGRSLPRRSFLRNRERDPHDISCEVWLLQSACSRAMASLLPPRACGLPRREKASHRWLPLSVATPGWSPRTARPRGTGWIGFRERVEIVPSNVPSPELDWGFRAWTGPQPRSAATAFCRSRFAETRRLPGKSRGDWI